MILLIFFIFNIVITHAQPSGFEEVNFDMVQFKHLSSSDGLAHDRVHSAIMDDQGNMWFGTQDGLSRWDGFSVKTYYPQVGDSTSISGSLVTDIAMDKGGCLWVVSHQGDICKYDPKSDNFRTYHYPEFENGVVLTSEMEVFIDSEEIIWIGAFDDGFVRFDPVKETFRLFNVADDLSSDDDKVRKNSVLVITEDPSDPNILWLGTNDGLFSFHKNEEKITSHISTDGSGIAGAIRGIEIDKDGVIWLATLGSGIAKYDRSSDHWQFIAPDIENWEKNNYTVNYIHDIAYKSTTEYWVSSAEYGAGIFNTDTKSFEFFKSNQNDPTAIRSEKGFKVYVDPTGRVWWMHDNKGVSYMDEACQIFHFQDFDIPNEQASWNRFLADFSIDPTTQKLYGVGHVRSGLFEIDHYNNEIKRIGVLGFDEMRNQFDAVLGTSFGELLVGGFQNSDASFNGFIYSPLLHLDRDIQKLVPFRPERFKSIQNKNINDIFEDSDRKIWIATDDGYLYSYEHDKDELKEFLLQAKNGSGINFIVEDEKRNQLYFATFDGIYGFDLDEEKFETIRGAEEFSSRGIYLSSNDSLLWIGTRQLGVQCYDIDKDRLLPVNKYRNAPRTPVEKVFLDINGKVWATTERGLFLFDEELEQFYDFNAKHGISEDYFYSQGVELLPDGTILLGQQKGYYFFQPEELMQTLTSDAALITDIMVNQLYVNKKFDDNGDLLLKLPYDKNSVSIGFSSISYCQQDKILFEYMLEGLEEDWLMPLGGIRTVNYPSLPDGNYTFKVKKLGDKLENIATVEIKITPPFWRTWLAYLVYTFAVLYAINWVFSAKIKRLKEKEELRIKISSDIHDDVGSLLTGLSMQSETMALNKEGLEKEELLEISKTGREAIERLRDIVWVLDSRRDKYENLLDRMKHFADSKFRKTNFDYSFDVGKLSEHQSISPDLRQSIYLIFKEAVTNLIKHSDGDIAKLSFVKEGSFLILSIYDNGSDQDVSKSDGLGMSNMQMRADKINGRLIIDNSKGFLVRLEVKV